LTKPSLIVAGILAACGFGESDRPARLEGAQTAGQV
jgi:hypothetical protein